MEKRSNKRFIPCIAAYATFYPYHYILGNIFNINLGGASILYLAENKNSNIILSGSEILIDIHVPRQNAFANNFPVKVTYDIFEHNVCVSEDNLLKIKKCGFSFYDLTSYQYDFLSHFLKYYTLECIDNKTGFVSASLSYLLEFSEKSKSNLFMCEFPSPVSPISQDIANRQDV